MFKNCWKKGVLISGLSSSVISLFCGRCILCFLYFRYRRKFVGQANQLHNCHNNYVLSLLNANAHQEHWRGSLLPFCLDTLQNRMELQITEWWVGSGGIRSYRNLEGNTSLEIRRRERVLSLLQGCPQFRNVLLLYYTQLRVHDRRF